MARYDDQLSNDLHHVMSEIVEHDFAIENCRELLDDIKESPAHVTALGALVRYHEVQRLKALGLVAGIQARLNAHT